MAELGKPVICGVGGHCLAGAFGRASSMRPLVRGAAKLAKKWPLLMKFGKDAL
jgi:hypothetical protein